MCVRNYLRNYESRILGVYAVIHDQQCVGSCNLLFPKLRIAILLKAPKYKSQILLDIVEHFIQIRFLMRTA